MKYKSEKYVNSIPDMLYLFQPYNLQNSFQLKKDLTPKMVLENTIWKV